MRWPFAPDGNLLAAAGRDVETGKFRVALYDLRTASTRSAGEHVHQVNSLAFTRDGRQLASADAKGNLQA